jgi:hypothetical protein
MEVARGEQGCQELFTQLGVRAFKGYLYARFHRMTVDAYALQHPARYCASAKSLMAHLGGLCCTFDYADEPRVHAALLRSLNGKPALEKPELPVSRGALTIAEALRAPDAPSYGEHVERWARCVWKAYEDLHPFARGWIQKALG